MNNVLLDTCAVLWLASGDKRLSADALAAIREAPIAYVSVVTAFEVALKHRAGKLDLPATPDEWFSTVVAHHGLTVLDLALADALRAPQLPDVHRDPCDRFILAAALRLSIAVVTADLRFAPYGVTVIG
jgi:PIN domain nuclease of toxin-antitoxin system